MVRQQFYTILGSTCAPQRKKTTKRLSFIAKNILLILKNNEIIVYCDKYCKVLCCGSTWSSTMSVARVAAVLQGALFLLGHAPWNTHGHGAVTHPRPRNGIDRNLPPWSLPMSQSNPNPKGVGQGICPAPDANGTVSGFNGQVPLPFRLSRSSSLDLFCITQSLWQCPPEESIASLSLASDSLDQHVSAAFTCTIATLQQLLVSHNTHICHAGHPDTHVLHRVASGSATVVRSGVTSVTALRVGLHGTSPSPQHDKISSA